MKLKKRKKTSRIRGAKTCGWGFRQKHKGHGNRGGVGMAGSGKRADHKKQKALESADGKYFGKQGLTSRGNEKKKNNVINLEDVKRKYGVGKIELKNYKILGKGDGFKGEIVAMGASKSAIEKMNKAGGKIILPAEKVMVKQYIIKEKKVEKEEVEGKVSKGKVEGKVKKVKAEEKASKEKGEGKVVRDKGKKKAGR